MMKRKSNRLILNSILLCSMGTSLIPCDCLAADNSQANLAGLQRAVQQAPGSDLAHYKLANALLSRGQKDPAMVEYRTAYMISQSQQMTTECLKVLTYYHMPLPNISNESLQLRIARAQLPQSTYGSLDDFMAIASRDNDKSHGQMDSSPEGVTAFKQCPETYGPMADVWHKWNEDFRIKFESILRRRYAALGIPAIYGQTKMIFSVDKSRHLHGRVLNSNLPPIMWKCLLETTRLMEGNQTLNFPSGTQVDGFNFTIGWDYPYPPPAVQQHVAALIRTNQTAGVVLPSRGLSANAQGLVVPGANTQTSAHINSANGKLLSGQGLQAQAMGLNGQQIDSNLLPKVDAEVSGKVMPKPKQQELKANAGKL